MAGLFVKFSFILQAFHRDRPRLIVKATEKHLDVYKLYFLLEMKLSTYFIEKVEQLNDVLDSCMSLLLKSIFDKIKVIKHSRNPLTCRLFYSYGLLENSCKISIVCSSL